MSVLRTALWSIGLLIAGAPISASAGPAVPQLGGDGTSIVIVRYDNCHWRNGHRVCVRVDSAGDSLVNERYMRPRDFRERDSNDSDFFLNGRRRGGTRSQSNERYQ